MPLFHGTVELPNLSAKEGASIVLMGDQYIVGRGILDLYEVVLDHGKRVIISPGEARATGSTGSVATAFIPIAPAQPA